VLPHRLELTTPTRTARLVHTLRAPRCALGSPALLLLSTAAPCSTQGSLQLQHELRLVGLHFSEIERGPKGSGTPPSHTLVSHHPTTPQPSPTAAPCVREISHLGDGASGEFMGGTDRVLAGLDTP
jgi:hypothetical protein